MATDISCHILSFWHSDNARVDPLLVLVLADTRSGRYRRSVVSRDLQAHVFEPPLLVEGRQPNPNLAVSRFLCLSLVCVSFRPLRAATAVHDASATLITTVSPCYLSPFCDLSISQPLSELQYAIIFSRTTIAIA